MNKNFQKKYTILNIQYTNAFKECTQCIFNVYIFQTISKNVLNSIYSIYPFSNNVYNAKHSMYTFIQRIDIIQRTQLFKESS